MGHSSVVNRAPSTEAKDAGLQGALEKLARNSKSGTDPFQMTPFILS